MPSPRVDRKTGHWWKNGGAITRNGITRRVEPIINRLPAPVESGRYLTETERVKIADGARTDRSARKIASEIGRAVSTVSRELQRNTSVDGEYRPHAAQVMMRARRPRPKRRLLERDGELRELRTAGCAAMSTAGAREPDDQSNCRFGFKTSLHPRESEDIGVEIRAKLERSRTRSNSYSGNQDLPYAFFVGVTSNSRARCGLSWVRQRRLRSGECNQ